MDFLYYYCYNIFYLLDKYICQCFVGAFSMVVYSFFFLWKQAWFIHYPNHYSTLLAIFASVGHFDKSLTAVSVGCLMVCKWASHLLCGQVHMLASECFIQPTSNGFFRRAAWNRERTSNAVVWINTVLKIRPSWEGEAGKGLFDVCHYKGILIYF